MPRALGILAALAVAAFLLLGLGGSAPPPQVLPPFPLIYSGSVAVAGGPAPDGMTIVARVKDRESDPVFTNNGRYQGLTVSLPDRSYVGATITFHMEEVQADETDIFREVNIFLDPQAATPKLDLTFPRFPRSILRFTPGIPITIPALGDPSVPGLPSVVLLVGVVLVVVGVAALRLARQRPEEQGQRAETRGRE